MKKKHPMFILMEVAGWFSLQPLLNLAVVLVATVGYYAVTGPYGELSAWVMGMSNLLLIVTNALVLAVIWLAARRKGMSLSRFTGLNAPMGGAPAVLMCMVGGAAANTWFSLVLDSGIVPAQIMDSYAEAYQLLEGGSPWVALVATVLAAPLAEELVFRGIILGRLRRVMPVGGAILVQAILFGVAHGNLLWGIYACVLGAVIGYLAAFGGGLRTAVCFHIAFNSGAYLYGLFGTGVLTLLVSGGIFLGAVLALCRSRDRLVS